MEFLSYSPDSPSGVTDAALTSGRVCAALSEKLSTPLLVLFSVVILG